MSKVKVVTRVSHHGEETLIKRGKELIGVLPEGDPLRYLLRLPADSLSSMRRELAPVLARRPELVRIFDAIIEYQTAQE